MKTLAQKFLCWDQNDKFLLFSRFAQKKHLVQYKYFCVSLSFFLKWFEWGLSFFAFFVFFFALCINVLLQHPKEKLTGNSINFLVSLFLPFISTYNPKEVPKLDHSYPSLTLHRALQVMATPSWKPVWHCNSRLFAITPWTESLEIYPYIHILDYDNKVTHLSKVCGRLTKSSKNHGCSLAMAS